MSARPIFSNAYIDLIARKGADHEAAFLEALRSEHRDAVEVGLGPDRDFSAALSHQAALPVAAAIATGRRFRPLSAPG